MPIFSRALDSDFLVRFPVAAFLGQLTGWSDTNGDPVLKLALKKTSRTGDDWKSLLSREPLPQPFYEWLGERFLNRAPSRELLSTADAVLSAVYTSSIDPGLLNLFATEGRQPEAVLIGDPPPPVMRSRRRVPVYYLFGRAGAGISDFAPPTTNQSLSQRRLRQASDVADFMAEVDKVGGVTVLIADSTSSHHRYDDILQAFRSRGHRVVVVGSSYIFEASQPAVRYIVALLRTANPDGHEAVTSVFENVNNLRTVRVHNLSTESKRDDYKKRQAHIWLVQNGGDRPDWPICCRSLCGEVTSAVHRLTEKWDRTIANEEDAASVVEELILAIDREWPSHAFDRIVESAATDIGLSGLDCLKYRESRLERWRELVGFFESREHAEAAVTAAIRLELEQLFGKRRSRDSQSSSVSADQNPLAGLPANLSRY